VHELKELMRKSNQHGMKTFDQALYDLYTAGEITYEDAIHAADSANELRLMIKLGDKAAVENMDSAVEGMTLVEDEDSDPGNMSFS
jgi:twitching motility protein PilU